MWIIGLDNGSRQDRKFERPRKLAAQAQCPRDAEQLGLVCASLPVPRLDACRARCLEMPRMHLLDYTSAEMCADAKPCLHVVADFSARLQYLSYTDGVLPSLYHAYHCCLSLHPLPRSYGLRHRRKYAKTLSET